MTNEAVRLLVDRIRRGDAAERRNIVFQPSLVVGNSCAPWRGD
jgi:LacI family transcriptional regulator